MTRDEKFAQWWNDNKIYWIESSRPAVESALAAWNAGYGAAINSVASGE
jgi:hypothetical protein